MLAHHAMPDFRCRSTCAHKECQRHAHLGVVDQHEQCKCLGEVNASSIFLENVLDLANTIAQIMIVCGIHECKAKSTVDITTYAFLHYDQVCYCLDTTPKKRLRKEDLFHELGRKCLMNRVEAHLAYNVIKRGFKAFYYKPSMYDPNDPDRPLFSEECAYVHAARKTAECYARYDGLSCEEQRGAEAKIKVAYKKFYDRMQDRRLRTEGEDCNCCFCAKKRGHLIYGKPPPCDLPVKKTNKCPICCKKKKHKTIHPTTASAKCPKCHRLKRFCICEKYKFSLCFVKSIWERNDFRTYINETIDEVEKRRAAGFPCGQPSDSQIKVPSVTDVIRTCQATSDSEEEGSEEMGEEEGKEGKGSGKNSHKASPDGSPKVSPKGSPKASPRGSPKGSKDEM